MYNKYNDFADTILVSPTKRAHIVTPTRREGLWWVATAGIGALALYLISLL